MGQKQLNLSWDPPTDNGGEKIVGYEIQYHDGTNWVALTGGDLSSDGFLEDATSHEDELSLDPGETRHYQIRAYNADYSGTGTADRSEDWVRRDDAMTAAADNPGAPTGLTAVNTSSGSVSLFWYAPEDDGGWPISHYVIQARRGVSGTSWKELPDLGAATGFDTGNIGDEVHYNFRIPKTDADGVTQETFGSIPQDYDHDSDGTTTRIPVDFNWEFRVFAETTDDGVDDNEGETADNMIRRSTGTSEIASVRAEARELTDHDDDTDTDAVDELQAPVPLATGTSPRDPKKEQINLTIPVPTDLDVQNAYRIDVSDGGDTWKLLIDDTSYTGFGTTDRVYEHVGLPYDASRSYRVFTVGTHWRRNVGPVSAEVEGLTAASEAPGKVTNVMAMSPDLMTIEAMWNAPDKNGGQPIVKYQYQYVIDDGDDVADEGDWDSPPAAVDTMDADLMETIKVATPGLTKEETYYIRFAAVNKTGGVATGNDRVGPWSDAAEFTTGEPAAPNMVEGLTSQVAVDTSGNVAGVLLIWNKPTAGTDVDNYVIERSMDGGTTWESPTADAETSTKARTSYTDPRHYVMGEMLAYRVAAENDAGMSDWVMVYYPRDPADMHSHMPDALTAPTSVTATVSGDDITVEWTGGSGPEGTKFAVGVFTRDFSRLLVDKVNNDASGGTYTIMDVPDGEYVVVVATYAPAAPTVGMPTRSNVVMVGN
jgi:titin